MSKTDYGRIDRYALEAPPQAEQSVEALARYLTAPAQNDTEKIRAIFRWITANITYDTQAYFTGSPHRSGDVLKDRTAVCDGFSTLFEQLGTAADLKIFKISGYAKGYNYRVGDHFSGPANHAWNAVQIDGRWQLIDATWGAGHMDESGRFVRNFDDYYFLTDPENLIYTHFPENKNWQLLPSKLSQDEFEALPYLKAAFFKNGLRLKNQDRGTIRCGDRLSVRLGNPEGAMLTARLLKDGREINERFTLVQDEGDDIAVHVHFPEKGTFTLRLFARGRHETGKYTWALDYRIEAAEAGESGSGFPLMFQSYQDRKARIIGPVEGLLSRGTSYTFDVIVPGALDVCLIQNGRWESMDQKPEDRFTKVLVPESGDLQIGARYSETTRYDILLKYEVK
ncbi:hypothetical protein JW948_09375 [bacterium]|nr:hypothetical protein [bacterium]